MEWRPRNGKRRTLANSCMREAEDRAQWRAIGEAYPGSGLPDDENDGFSQTLMRSFNYTI